MAIKPIKKENLMFTIEDVAKICHEANKALCESIGDKSQVLFDEAPDWQRQSAINGVKFCLLNPNAPPSANHESWLAEKQANGWTFGPAKDAKRKEHPCMVPYEDLPEHQKAKDYLFKAIVDSMKTFLVK